MRERFVAMLMMMALTVFGAVPALAAGSPNLGEGQLADVAYGSTAVEWRIGVEHESATLTISTPCGTIQRAYQAGKNPFFALEELSPDDPNGLYTWQIRIAPVVDPDVRAMLEDARGTSKEQDTVRYLRRKGLLPQGPFLQSGSFSVVEGGIVTPVAGEEKRSSAQHAGGNGLQVSGVSPESIAGSLETAIGQQVISGDLTVYNSLCVGFDCSASESFGADTIRLKENNLRIHVDDTSTAASFPSTDWRLEFNSNLNGGGGWFRVIDVSANRNVMTIEAGAPSHALYVDNGGRVGTGTANPVLEFHAANGDTPGLRLEQTVASGFAAQTWDLAGNETSFFIRDASNGSTLPFRIRPGSSSNALVIDTDSDVGIGILTTGTFTNTGDQAALHIRRTDASQSGLLVERATASAASDVLLELRNNGTPRFDMVDTASGTEWRFEASGSGFNINDLADAGSAELVLATNGDLTIEGDLTANGTNYPSSRTLKEGFLAVDSREVLQRLAAVPVTLWTYKSDEQQTPHIGPVTEDFSAAFDFLEADGKLNTIDLHGVALAAIQGLNEIVVEKDARIQELEQRLEALEALLPAQADE